MEPFEVPIGSRYTLSVTPMRDGERLVLLLDVATPWGPVRATLGAADQTIRGIIMWLRSSYGSQLYTFVMSRMPGYEALAKMGRR